MLFVFAPLLPESIRYEQMIKENKINISDIIKESEKLFEIYKKDHRLSKKCQKTKKNMIYVPHQMFHGSLNQPKLNDDSDSLSYDDDFFVPRDVSFSSRSFGHDQIVGSDSFSETRTKFSQFSQRSYRSTYV